MSAPLDQAPQVFLKHEQQGWMVRLIAGAWTSLPPEDARKLAAELIDHADLAEGKTW